MGKIPTAIYSGKPLLILSVAVSLFLHSGGFSLPSSIKIPEKISARFSLNQFKEERKVEVSNYPPRVESSVIKKHTFSLNSLPRFSEIKSSSSLMSLTFSAKNPSQIISFSNQKEPLRHKLTPIFAKKIPFLPFVSLPSLQEEKFNKTYPTIHEEAFSLDSLLYPSTLVINLPLQKSQVSSIQISEPSTFCTLHRSPLGAPKRKIEPFIAHASIPILSLMSPSSENVIVDTSHPFQPSLEPKTTLSFLEPSEKRKPLVSLPENQPTRFPNFDLDVFVIHEDSPHLLNFCKKRISNKPLFSLDVSFVDKHSICSPPLQEKKELEKSFTPACEYSFSPPFSYDLPKVAVEKSHHDYSLIDQIGEGRKEELALLEPLIPPKSHPGKPDSLDLDTYLSTLLPLNQNEVALSPFHPLMEKKEASEEIPSFFTKIDSNSSLSNNLVENYERAIASQSSVDMASPDLQMPLDREDALAVNQSVRFTQGLLAEIPHPLDLETISLNNSFETEVFYAPRYNAEGYLFAVKVKPNKKLYFETPLQNIIFILDGSETVGRDRYNVYREAVDKALSRMHHGDTFSIMISDPQLEILCPSPLEWNPLTVRRARSFLLSKSYKGYCYKYDIFSFLDEITPFLSDERENVVILLTDGNSLGGIKCYRDEFLELLAENNGKFSLFVAATSRDNNLLTLDFLSTFNNGSLMYSQTNAAFSRKLSILVKHVENLVAKDIHLTVAGHEENKNIEFYPNDNALPYLYSDTPYMIYGTIKKLADFDLIIQGRAGDHWLNIEQHISFKDAERANASTRRNFAMQQAYVCYDYFLKENDPFFLCEMDRILEPYHLSSDR